jgi:hypothetical protein
MGSYRAIRDYCCPGLKNLLAKHDEPSPILASPSLFPSTKRRRESVSHHKPS